MPRAPSPTTTLWRPCNDAELGLVADSGWRRWPPRLDWQPIFYPVLNQEYATELARGFQVPAFGVSHVTRFEVDSAYLAQFDVQRVGSNTSLSTDPRRGTRRVQRAHHRHHPGRRQLRASGLNPITSKPNVVSSWDGGHSVVWVMMLIRSGCATANRGVSGSTATMAAPARLLPPTIRGHR